MALSRCSVREPDETGSQDADTREREPTVPTDDIVDGRDRTADLPRRPLPLAATGVTLDIAERRILDDVSLQSRARARSRR